MMTRGLFAALTFCLGLTVIAPSARAIDLSDIVNTLETPFQAETAAEDRILDYSADFSQESKIASLDRLQRANGRVEVAFDYHAGQTKQTVQTVRFRWQYDSPTTQEIVSDGETMWVYLPENNQVIQSNVEQIKKADQNDPMAFLTGLGNLSRDFSINWAMPNQDGEGNYRLEMIPRHTSSLIRNMVIVVDSYAVTSFRYRDREEDQVPGGLRFPILSTTVYDPNGNSTVIKFSNLRVNLGLPDASFEFMVPDGVQVVRPTGEGTGF
jgi:outer membrane lipoprotein carrier protein